jgi:signal transduction histidine kinase
MSMPARTARLLWEEPRAPDPPGPKRLDWFLVALAVTAAVVEALARPELAWRALSLVAVVAVAFTLPWRRTHSLLVVLLAFGTMSTLDVVALLVDVEWAGLDSAVFLLLLLYALARWASGREVVAGLGVVSVPVLLTAVSGESAGDLVGGVIVVLLAAAVGVVVRYERSALQQQMDGARSREREQLARELHDTVAHHVSAIAIQAQAGRTLAATRPAAAAQALVVIEEEASRTLEEMRTMVGALRRGADADLVPQQGVADIERLASGGEGDGSTGSAPMVDVELSGDLAGLPPAVDAAVYRLAREAVTNAIRHAHDVEVVRVRVRGDADVVHLAVHDDGRGSATPGTGGFGLVGMAERAKILGGTLEAGPRPGGGWSVAAVLPRHGSTS